MTDSPEQGEAQTAFAEVERVLHVKRHGDGTTLAPRTRDHPPSMS